MTDKNATPATAPETALATAPKTTPAKSEHVRVSGLLPHDLYDALYGNHRFEVRKDKGEFLEFVFTEYARLAAVSVNKV